MYRATTPQHTFTLPFQTNTISKLILKYQQGACSLVKKETDVTMSGYNITCTLTQQETKMFNEGTVEVQIRVKTTNGTVLASDIMDVNIYQVLDEEVL